MVTSMAAVGAAAAGHDFENGIFLRRNVGRSLAAGQCGESPMMQLAEHDETKRAIL